MTNSSSVYLSSLSPSTSCPPHRVASGTLLLVWLQGQGVPPLRHCFRARKTALPWCAAVSHRDVEGRPQILDLLGHCGTRDRSQPPIPRIAGANRRCDLLACHSLPLGKRSVSMFVRICGAAPFG